MNMPRLAVGVLLTATCLLSGCHTPGGGPLRCECFDHLPRDRSWILHSYFEPNRSDYHQTCWNQMAYDPCTCCWAPGMPGEYIYDESPTPPGEAIVAPPPSAADPIDRQDPIPELPPLDADPLPRLDGPAGSPPNVDGFVPDNESSFYRNPTFEGPYLPVSSINVAPVSNDESLTLRRLPHNDY